MLVRLNNDSMLALWKRRHFIDPIIEGPGEITRNDYAQIDAICRDAIDQWYSNLLLTAPLHLLDVLDVTSTAVAERTGRIVRINFTSDVVRVASVLMPGWQRAAAVVDANSEEGIRIAAEAANHYLCGGPSRPLVLWRDKGLDIITKVDSIEPLSIRGVIAMEGEYAFDQAAINF